MNGFGSWWVIPSTLIWSSSIASSSADCTFGEERFISSASRKLHIAAPGRYSLLPLFMSMAV